MNKRQNGETRHVDFLLIGGGVASATAAETLRQEGAEGTIAIVSAEQELPYHRPPLSTHFLLSDSPSPITLVLTADYYREHDITVLLGTPALGVEPKSRIVHTDQAGPIHYDKLLLATGARPVRLRVPGAELPGIHYLRTVDDARSIKQAASMAKHAVVVGGGFISLELSAALVQRGVRVTLLAKGPRSAASSSPVTVGNSAYLDWRHIWNPKQLSGREPC